MKQTKKLEVKHVKRKNRKKKSCKRLGMQKNTDNKENLCRKNRFTKFKVKRHWKHSLTLLEMQLKILKLNKITN